MAINPKDDYESLARLLYPSIEASGNVYYGQTRKLTMDEILGKNGLGFESHIESAKVDNNSADYGFTYDSYFCWKLGSLKGSIKIILGVNDKTADTFPDASKIILRTASGDTIIKYNTESNSRAMNGTAYACYIINSESKKVENNLHSGVYNTYEKEMSAQFDCICVTESDINPADVTKPVEDIENRNFFFNYDDRRLYVKVCSGSINNHITDDSESSSVDVWGPDSHTFRIKAIDGDIKVSYSVHGTNNDFIDNFRMAYRTEPNEGHVVLQPNESITIESGKSVAFELYDPEYSLTPNRLPIISDGDLIFSSKWPTMTVTDELPDQETLDNNLAYAQFHMSKVNQSSNAHVKLIGSLGNAFGDQNYDHPSCAVFANLFKDCTLITELDDNFILDYFGPRGIQYAYYRFYQTFSGCTGLTKASICTKHLYNNMFVKTYKDCVNVREVKFDIGLEDYSESEAYEDDAFSGCDQSDCIYTVALFNDKYQKRHSYLNFDENLYITARSMVPQYWHLDNGWLLFVRDAAVNATTININIANSITWTSQSESTLDKNHLFQYMYSDSDDLVNDWQWLNTNTGVEFTGDHNRGIFIRLRTDVTFDRRYNGDAINFIMTSSTPEACSIKAYGSIRSLRGQLHLSPEIKNFEFAYLFENCTLLTRAPSIDRFSPFMMDLNYEDSEFSNYEFGCYAFSYMFHGCTSLLEFPKISAWCLAKGAFLAAFNGCTSLSNITKMSDWFDSDLIPGYYYALPAVIGSGVFSGMFEGCTSLRSVPEILFSGSKPSSYWGEAPIFKNNAIPARTYYETFSGCRSLRTLLASGVSNSDFSQYQFVSTMEGITDYYRCVFFTDQDNIDWKGLQYIPDKWALAGENKFNCRLLESDGEFKSGLIVASGTDSKKNGRGLVTSKSTNANMLQSSPMLSDNPPKMDAYDQSNGQYNQDIWGIKCFNSPVQFRNGIYTDTSNLVDLHNNILSGSKLHTSIKNIGSDSAVATSCYELIGDNQAKGCHRACHSIMTASMIDSADIGNPTENVITNSINNWSRISWTDTNQYPARTACMYATATSGKVYQSAPTQSVYSTVMSSRADNNSAVIFAHATTDDSTIPSSLSGAEVTITARVKNNVAGVTCMAKDDTSLTIIEGDELDIFSDELIIRPYEVVPVDNEYSLGTAENRFKELNVINSYSGTLNTDDIQPIGYNSFVINMVQSDGYIDGTSAYDDYSTAIQIINELVEDTISSISNAIDQLHTSSRPILLTHSSATSSTMSVLHLKSWVTVRAANNRLAHNGGYIGYTTMSYDGYTSNVGSQSKPFDNIYAKSFNGVMPYYPYYLASSNGQDYSHGARGTQTIVPPLGSILTVRFLLPQGETTDPFNYLRFGSQITKESGVSGWRIMNYGAGGNKGTDFFPTLPTGISLTLCDFTDPDTSGFAGNDTEITKQDGVAFTVLSASFSTRVLLVMRIK